MTSSGDFNMADLSIRFYSDVLKRDVSFLMQIPNDIRRDYPRNDLKRDGKPMKTLFLLHGYSGAAFNWVPGNLAEQYNFAVVIPSGENSFWIDGPRPSTLQCLQKTLISWAFLWAALEPFIQALLTRINLER